MSTSISSGATVNFNGAKVVANNSGTGTLLFPVSVTINLNKDGVVDFGSSSSAISMIDGVLNLNDLTSSVTPNAPLYGSTSKLVYKSGGTYRRGKEWSANSGAGYPNDIQVSNNTTLDVPNTGAGAFSTNLALARDLTIDSGSSIFMGYGDNGNKSGSLTIGGNLLNNGNFGLGNAVGGDFTLKGNWTKGSTANFYANGRTVNFIGTAAQTITGATTFDFLTINNPSGVILASPITNVLALDFTNGKLTLGANNLTIGNGGTIINATATKYVVTDGAGQLKRTVGAGNILFPIGPSATNYNPITVTNTGALDVYGFRVKPGVADAVDLTYMINDSWYGSEANPGGGAIRVVPEWSSGDIGANFSFSDNFIELYSPAITSYPATISGTTASLTNGGDQFSNNLTGAEYFAVSKSRPQEINIKQGTTNINHNGNFSVGSQISGTISTPITFTVENTGQANLTVGALTITGANTSEFTITQAVNSTVVGGAFTTFTVTFSPTSTGAKTAQLSLVNNDSNENPYKINLTGTGTASAESHVLVDTGFTYPQNILYVNYVDNSHSVSLVNSIEVARFIVSDGAVGTGDVDNLPTNVNSLSFSVTNAPNLDRIALYDGATKLGEVNGNTTPIGFGSLTLSIPDDTSKTLSVRVLFNTAVTDNQRIIFSGGLRTAQNTGSTFVGSDAPQETSTTGNNNVIEVVADRLAFTTQPTNTGVNIGMSDVVVSAWDLYNNIDLDLASGAVSLTSTGTMTGTPISQSFSSGKATFTGIKHTATGTGFTLTATTTGLAISNTVTSTMFDITTDSSVNGDY